jgi:hypothetical protein
MKYKFIDPNQILSVVLALMVLGIGVFATFTVFANIPTTTPVASNQRLGNATWTQTPTIATSQCYSGNDTSRWIPTPGALNNTGVCIVYGLTGTRGTATVPHWIIIQTIGAVNGTFMANGTLRYRQAAQLGPHINNNLTFRVEYALANQQTSALQNASFYAVINVSGTSSQVFNIIGVVLIIASIMSIVALVYTYIKPKM